jgi:hypothetical protein
VIWVVVGMETGILARYSATHRQRQLLGIANQFRRIESQRR